MPNPAAAAPAEFDPWAVVEVEDTSEKWSGMPIHIIKTIQEARHIF